MSEEATSFEVRTLVCEICAQPYVPTREAACVLGELRLRFGLRPEDCSLRCDTCDREFIKYRAADRADLLKYLARAGRRVSEGERRIERQRDLIALLAIHGRETGLALNVLMALLSTQQTLVSERERLARTVTQSQLSL